MYEKYCEKSNLKYSCLEDADNLTTIQINDENNFLLLENGLHKLTRISPFGNGKLHTSIVKVGIHSQKELNKIIIHQKDLIFEDFKSSGPGGQHKNKRETAIRLKHIPTNIITIADSRSQANNKEQAVLQLKLKLLEKSLAEKLEKKSIERLNNNNDKLIRSYLLNHNMIVDEKTKLTTQKVKQVLNGNLNYLVIKDND